MGVLDTLSNWNETYKEGADSVLDNETFSLQDKTRGAIQTVTDAPTDEDEFAKESDRFFQGISHTIAAPGRFVGDKTEGTVVDNRATDATVRGGETVYDMFVKYPLAVGYGTVTGADTRGREADQASGDYTPGMLDSLELLALGTPIGKAGTAGAKAAVKGGSNMGALSKIGRFLKRGDDVTDTARASDEAVTTQAKLAPWASRSDSTVSRTLKTPDEFRPGGYGSIKEAIADNKLLVGTAGGLGLFGASGLMDMGMPTNYERADQFSQPPGATLVKETNNANDVLGYWVVIDQSGGSYTILNAGGTTTSSVELPTQREPTFSSSRQARAAFTTFSSQYQSENQQTTPTYGDDPPEQQSAWHETTTVNTLQSGWNLYQQKRRGEDKYRYAIAGAASNGNTLFISAGGTASTSPDTFPDKEQAMEAYREWKSTGGTAPDTSQQRPPSDAVAASLESVVTDGGALGNLGTIALGAGAIIAAILIWRALQ